MPERRAGLRIGVVADTHGLLRPELVDLFRDVDHILHAGDLGRPGLVERLAEVAPVTAIRGNVDRGDWAAAFPEQATIELGGRRIHLIHDRKALAPATLAARPDLIVVGHTHRAGTEERDGMLILNPGSAGPRRFRLPVTAATVLLAEGPLAPRIHRLVE